MTDAVLRYVIKTFMKLQTNAPVEILSKGVGSVLIDILAEEPAFVIRENALRSLTSPALTGPRETA